MLLPKTPRSVSLLLSFLALWVMVGTLGFALEPQAQSQTTAKRTTPASPGNPDNPCNPCNPNRGGTAANPCNPCNPNRGGTAANPCAGKANPCNPCNPRNAAGGTWNVAGGKKIAFGTDYLDFDKVTGYLDSRDHGNRLAVVYVSPRAAAQVYRRNATLLRAGRKKGFQPFPTGAVIVMESWHKTPGGRVGTQGPLFMMKKEAPGYDAEAGNWRYGFTRSDFRVVGEGHSGPMAYCRECHQAARTRDYVRVVGAPQQP